MHHGSVHVPSLAKRVAPILATAVMAITCSACGRKGDPVPRPRALPGPCAVSMVSLRRLKVRLPDRDLAGAQLTGVERVRIYYLTMGTSQPAPQEVVTRGEIVLERSRPDLPGPGQAFELDLSGFRRGRGWLAVVAVRVGDVVGPASETLPWLDPEL